MTPIQVEVTLTRKDYNLAYQRQFWRALRWFVFLVPLVALIPMWKAPSFRHELQSGQPAAYGSAVILYVAVALFLALMVEILARSYTGMAIRKTPLALASKTLTFSEEGMRVVTETPNAEPTVGFLKWSDFLRIDATRSAYQLHFGPKRYVLLPYSRFGAKGDAERMRQLFKERLGGRARFTAPVSG